MSKTTYQGPSKNLELYERVVATNPRVSRKGAGTPYTSVNGNMFSFLTETGILALRLGAEEREEFLKKFETRLSVRYGTVMKEYVEVPATLLENTQELKKYFDLSYAYAASLKPKPTTKKGTDKNVT